ncbi:mitochondrial amidoxime-reducing component 1 [Lepeophtheirus salmonis]|uniref:mitochondrial amidoxime-reducing component 1 n=1 Tax=Lepeophtheirus salmonis TaxID=72036 RepID=UPI001AE32583|nr:mitochondrial amidoxime-reducing component 1-like [Lepeophtheirus salmonis]
MANIWNHIGVLDRIYIYPLKSGKGLPVQKAKVDKYGLTHQENEDRRFVLVDSVHDFKVMTGRRYHGLVKVELSKSNSNTFTLKAPGVEPFTGVLPSSSSLAIETNIFGNTCRGYDCGDAASLWFGKYLQLENLSRCRLLYHCDKKSSRSLIDSKQLMTSLSKVEDVPFYADGYPILLTTSRSVKYLNEVLKNQEEQDLIVDHKRFRTNIHIQNNVPFDEDNWTRIRIGSEAFFRNDGPCRRCNFTTIDPVHGLKNGKNQPLKTLSTFRVKRELGGNSPCFGINLGVDTPGSLIEIGDPVFVTYVQ